MRPREPGCTPRLQDIFLFATIGDGAPQDAGVPWSLVVRGAYRLVRNAMMSGVLFVLLGPVPLLVWFLIFLALNVVSILL
jgi:protein-S-isoprenylcysteine O-methyltransferase Ste14